MIPMSDAYINNNPLGFAGATGKTNPAMSYGGNARENEYDFSKFDAPVADAAATDGNFAEPYKPSAMYDSLPHNSRL